MQTIVVVDATFGDAGKGSLVDFLTRQHNAHTIIRFNGGAQAAHNVVLPDGRHHTFSQFGSGTFVPGVRTHLSRYMLFDPVALASEERHLRSVGVGDALARLSLDRDAAVVTPFQRAANRLREVARGSARHGSCGMGIGETMADKLDGRVLRAGDLQRPALLRRKLREMQEAKRAMAGLLNLPRDGSSGGLAARELDLLRDDGAAEEFAELFEEMGAKISIVDSSREVLRAAGTVIFEGAQGVLLDEWHGFHPHTTWSTTTFANAMALLREMNYAGRVTRIGAMRAYMTRHGAGPLVTEESSLRGLIPEGHNVLNDWQHDFRIGWLDLPMLRYALDVSGGVDALAVTCLDKLQVLPRWRVCTGYQGLGEEFLEKGRIRVAKGEDLDYQARLGAALARSVPLYEEVGAPGVVSLIAERLGPVGIASWGPTCQDKVSTLEYFESRAA